MRIHSILLRKGSFVATIRPDATALDASRALRSHSVGALVVSADGASVEGILSERDLARSIAEHGPDTVALQVRELMTREVRTCSPHDTVDGLAAVMTEHRVRHLPVLEAGHLVGIISIGDVVKHRLDELEQEAKTLHEYLETGHYA